MESACGPWGRRLTSLCVVVYCFGTTITFLIIIGDQFDRALASLRGHDFCHVWYLARTFTMPASAVVFILPLCYSRRIDFLKLPSAVGVVAIFYIGEHTNQFLLLQEKTFLHITTYSQWGWWCTSTTTRTTAPWQHWHRTSAATHPPSSAATAATEEDSTEEGTGQTSSTWFPSYASDTR